jgi:hypothetical protein
MPGGSCQKCNCSTNWVESDTGNCDPHSGQCKKCLYFTEVRSYTGQNKNNKQGTFILFAWIALIFNWWEEWETDMEKGELERGDGGT